MRILQIRWKIRGKFRRIFQQNYFKIKFLYGKFKFVGKFVGNFQRISFVPKNMNFAKFVGKFIGNFQRIYNKQNKCVF